MQTHLHIQNNKIILHKVSLQGWLRKPAFHTNHTVLGEFLSSFKANPTFYPTSNQSKIRFNIQYLTWNCEVLSIMENLIKVPLPEFWYLQTLLHAEFWYL